MSHSDTKDSCHTSALRTPVTLEALRVTVILKEIRSFVTPHNAQNIQAPVVNIQTLPDRELRSVVKLSH